MWPPSQWKVTHTSIFPWLVGNLESLWITCFLWTARACGAFPAPTQPPFQPQTKMSKGTASLGMLEVYLKVPWRVARLVTTITQSSSCRKPGRTAPLPWLISPGPVCFSPVTVKFPVSGPKENEWIRGGSQEVMPPLHHLRVNLKFPLSLRCHMTRIVPFSEGHED